MMLVNDLEYMEVASSEEIEGGFATGFGSAMSMAFGNNTSQTNDVSTSFSSQVLVPGFVAGTFIANFNSNSSAVSQSTAA